MVGGAIGGAAGAAVYGLDVDRAQGVNSPGLDSANQ